MTDTVALRLVRGGQRANVEILRALAFDNQSANFTAGLTVTGIGIAGVATLTGTTIGAGDTVTIGTQVYTFGDPLVDTADHVLVGASDSDSLDNLIAAINGDAGEGTLYGTGTVPRTDVVASAGASDTMVLTEAAPVTALVLATTAVLTSGDWDVAVLTGGIAASLASGVLDEQVDGGTSGTLILRDVVGEFTNNELVTDSSTGSALANGTLTVPLLTPSDSMILQADALEFKIGEAIDALEALEAKILTMPWHADNGLFALRVVRGGQAKDVLRLGALAFDGQTTSFTAGDVISGATSLATGRLIEQVDAGSSGTLILADIVGTFTDNNVLTDEHTGNGDAVNGQTIPLLTPADSFILQMDGVDYTKADALEGLRQIKAAVLEMAWPFRAAA